MSNSVAIYLVPITILAISIYMAMNMKDPMWLIFGAVFAIAAGYIARQTFGS